MRSNSRRWAAGLAAAVLAAAMLSAGVAYLRAAATAQDSLYYRLVGLVNSSGTQTSPATEDTLSAVSAALGGGEDVQTGIKAMTDQALPVNADIVVARQAGQQIVVVGAVVSAYSDTYVTWFSDATTASLTVFVPGGDQVTWPLGMAGWFECADGDTLKVKSNGGTGEVMVRWVAR